MVHPDRAVQRYISGAHVNLTVIVLLLMLYGAFTRSFLDINRWTLSDWSNDNGGPVALCADASGKFQSCPYVPALMGLKNEATAYGDAIVALRTEWYTMGLPSWSAFLAVQNAQTPHGTSSATNFRDYLATKAAPPTGHSTGLNEAGVLHDWLVRIQVQMQLSDTEFNQLFASTHSSTDLSILFTLDSAMHDFTEAEKVRMMGYVATPAGPTARF